MARRHEENGSFELLLSPDREASRFYARLLQRIGAELVREIGEGGLSAIVLSGSLAQGEGVALRAAGGGLEPGSDIDLYLVTAEENVAPLNGRIPEIRSRILSLLGEPGLVVDLGATSPDRLGALPPSIANSLLVRYGKTIWGDRSELERAARPALDEIPPWDGFLLLLNRTVEELAEMALHAPSGRQEREYWYRFGKTVRDLGTSALAVAGRFRATAGERFDELERVIEDEAFPSALAEELAFWFAQKVAPDFERARERYGGEGAFRAAQLRKSELLRVYFDWEAGRLFGEERRGPARVRMAGGERLRRRLRRWFGFARDGGPGAWGVVLRHLGMGLPLSPLRANYAAAVHLLLSWGPLFGERVGEEDRRNLEEARKVAPLPGSDRGDFREEWLRLREAVCVYWDREVMGSTRPPARLEIG